jgi:hypothetical protein
LSSSLGVLDASGLLVAINRAHGCGETGGWNTGTSMEFVFKKVPQVRDVVVGGWLSFL